MIMNIRCKKLARIQFGSLYHLEYLDSFAQDFSHKLKNMRNVQNNHSFEPIFKNTIESYHFCLIVRFYS